MIEETIKLITESPNYFPSSGDNLLGMEIDIAHCLESSKTFNLVSLGRTNSSSCMFDIKLNISETVKEYHEIRSELRELWEFIKYLYYEASSLVINSKSAELHFITIIGKNQFYVTGKIVVEGINYELLAKNS